MNQKIKLRKSIFPKVKQNNFIWNTEEKLKSASESRWSKNLINWYSCKRKQKWRGRSLMKWNTIISWNKRTYLKLSWMEASTRWHHIRSSASQLAGQPFCHFSHSNGNQLWFSFTSYASNITPTLRMLRNEMPPFLFSGLTYILLKFRSNFEEI